MLECSGSKGTAYRPLNQTYENEFGIFCRTVSNRQKCAARICTSLESRGSKCQHCMGNPSDPETHRNNLWLISLTNLKAYFRFRLCDRLPAAFYTS